ncbi:D-aminoacyl-tRNA deacylase [Roseicitreum antarcticum]|uniref:D-aminoacyl-tRNA deacylase n=1 Tax=Roseicitreum antarcticum TaxID=564137 RepID=A0A1H2U448_9RHOB|nr:D-aminoacyl-tRNA deacylase [Roseicitreum antarcticum]SDW50840.1 D-tyrosyl-tRNA(Tyr) deacylase [Roseicitreum antarcticum]
MRALVQRVTQASVTVKGAVVGEIGPGAMVLICAMAGDTQAQADQMAAKIARLRIFRDEAGKMNLSLLQTAGAVLLVSQFTLAADTSRGNRPGFSAAAPPDAGALLVDRCGDTLRGLGVSVATGVFGADMAVSLVNDGPVTLWLEV